MTAWKLLDSGGQEMLTPDEKKIVAEKMGWEWYTLGGGIFYYRMIGEIEVPIEFRPQRRRSRA